MAHQEGYKDQQEQGITSQTLTEMVELPETQHNNTKHKQKEKEKLKKTVWGNEMTIKPAETVWLFLQNTSSCPPNGTGNFKMDCVEEVHTY